MIDKTERHLRLLRDPENRINLGYFQEALQRNLSPPNDSYSPQENLVQVAFQGTEGGGTALLLNAEGFVLTCYHLVRHLRTEEGMLERSCIRIDGQEAAIDPKFLVWDEDYDLALLRALGCYTKPTIALAEQQVCWAENLCYFPFVQGEVQELEGRVALASYDVVMDRPPTIVVRSDAFVVDGEGKMGYSGSPFFRGKELVGILFGGTDPGENASIYGTKSRYVRNLVQDAIDHIGNLQNTNL
ncbi:MAG: serine protease [Nanoarchaeota archaeon]